MKRVKRILMLLLTMLYAVTMMPAALAAEGNVTYSGDAGQFIFSPGSEYSPTDLFPDFKDVMPGDRLNQKLLVKNDASKAVDVTIYIRSQGALSGSEAFLSQMRLSVQIPNEEAPLFDAPADQTGQLTDWVCLGTFTSGAEMELDLVLDVPTTMGNDCQEQIGKLRWEFWLLETPVTKPGEPEVPKTGDTSNIMLYGAAFAASGAALILLLILFFKRRKEDEEEA